MIEHKAWRWLSQLALCLGLGLGSIGGVGAFQRPMPAPGAVPAQPTATINLADLPQAGRSVYARILAGGPFASDKDGSVFFNRERKLPVRARGAYHEYTVPTPGARNRGTRRIVCEGPERTPEVCYYTADHYETFSRIQP